MSIKFEVGIVYYIQDFAPLPPITQDYLPLQAEIYFIFPDTTIKALTATDYDESATLTYVLSTSSSPSSYDTFFSLEDGNTLKLKSTINLDPPDNAEDMFYLIVMATDGGSPALTGSTTVIVSITAVNEETPTFTDTDVVIEVSNTPLTTCFSHTPLQPLPLTRFQPKRKYQLAAWSKKQSHCIRYLVLYYY